MTDRRSAEAAAYRRLYKTAQWKALRLRQLSAEPLCRFCLEAEDVTAATVVDHIRAHKGDVTLFFDPSNLRSLCKPHHDRDGHLLDNGKTVVRYDASGWPI